MDERAQKDIMNDGTENGMAGPDRESFAIAIIVAAIVLVLALQWSVVKPYGQFNATYYDELADAFLAAQTSFLRLPPPAMMALPDPYYPKDNESFRLRPEIPGERFTGVHDLALYNGLLYAQWGPVPALMLIPLRALAGHDLPLGYMTLVLATLAEVAYGISAWLLARLCGLVPTRLTGSLLVAGLLLCPFWTFTLNRVAVYEISIFTGQFFVALAFLSVSAAFYGRLVQGREHPALLGLASLFIGLALGCRLNLAMLGLMLPVILLLWWRTDPRCPAWWRMAGPAAALVLPAGGCLAGIFVYNYIRFGNILEIGQSWQLWAGQTSMPEHKFLFFSLVRLAPNVLYYILAPPKISMDFVPHTLPNTTWPPRWLSPETIVAYQEQPGYGKEAVVGLFAVAPMAALALLIPLLFRRQPSARATATSAGRRLGPGLLILLAPALLLSVPMLLAPATMRYGAEWCMPWVMTGALIAMWIDRRLETTGSSLGLFLFRLGIALNIVWTTWIAICFLYLTQ
jgi:hypothetical protein